MIHAQWNKEHNAKIETVFLPCDEKLASLSSTLVRGFIDKKEYDKLQGVVACEAIEILKGYACED